MNIKTGDKKVILELLSSCNLNCSHCFYRVSNKFDYSDFLLKEEIFVLIRKMVKNKINKLVLTGGEPTLHPDFIEISKYAMLKIAKISICTNGVISDSELENEIIKLNFSTYTVSIDSHIESVHDKFRGRKGAFLKTVAFIKKLNLNDKNVSIHITIHPDNINHIEETINFCKGFSKEIVVSSIYHNKLSEHNKLKGYNQELINFKKKYLNSSDVILVGFTPFCENKNCLDQKNIFMINRKGELVSCYWKKGGGTFIKKY
ncbi:MAG: Radical SAM domain protein [Berkelbacteria bacterium GW2011_GWA1_36_9]|uniref:Radical SAM domain protein n=1 Tax=Berkelbacteria bacterium GW2011_GWA1_36_9 TaxID=1618331 RepID=A0A0G0IRH6_9BACT|nr:MAG: Radical SAM domain protein [Berkelbacteria bacterium GW2011_GWA1_36_9]